jgi:hypothetical protein
MLRMITSDWGATSVLASRVHSAACRLFIKPNAGAGNRSLREHFNRMTRSG